MALGEADIVVFVSSVSIRDQSAFGGPCRADTHPWWGPSLSIASSLKPVAVQQVTERTEDGPFTFAAAASVHQNPASQTPERQAL